MTRIGAIVQRMISGFRSIGAKNRVPVSASDGKVVTAARHGFSRFLPGFGSQAAEKSMSGRKVVIHEDYQIFCHLAKLSKRKFEKQTVKPVDVVAAVRYCKCAARMGHLTPEHQRQIRDFITDKLSLLSKENFHRHTLLAGDVALQKILSTELADLLELEEADPSLKEVEEHQLKVSIAKAKLAVSLGHGIKKAGNGVNGALIIKSLENETVGVFKPEKKLRWYQFGEHLKKVFGQARLLSKLRLSGEYAEVMAYKMDRILGFDMAPGAKLCQIQGDDGAFLAFLGGYQELKEVTDTLEAKESYTDREKILFQKMSLYDFLTGNMDGHNENIFIRMRDGNVDEVRVIDHGNAFIEYNPGALGSKGNQYAWGSLKIAREGFHPEVIEFVRSMDEEDLERFVQECRPDFMTPAMKERLQERFFVLKERVAYGKVASPAELAKIHTDSDFKGINAQTVDHSFEDGDILVIDVR